MHLQKFAIVTKCYSQPLKQSIRLAAESGAQGVQLDARSEIRPTELSITGRKQLTRQLESFRLKLAAVEFIPQKAIYAEDRIDARIDAIKAAMQLSCDLNSKLLVTRVGYIPPEEDEEFQLLVDLLNDLTRTGNRIGCSLAILPSRNPPESYSRLFARVEGGAIGVCYDPASFYLAGHDPLDAIRKLHSEIFLVRVRDAIRDVDGIGQETTVGRGDLLWDELTVSLEEAGYRGWWSVVRTDSDDKAGDISRAIRYLQTIATGG